MSEEPAARPARRSQPRIPVTAAAGAALVVGLVGYAIGHGVGASAGTATPTLSSSACATVNDASTRQIATIQASPGDPAATRTLANLIVQNRGCFDPQLVAGAQTVLDNLNQGAAADAARDAVCGASDEPWWSC